MIPVIVNKLTDKKYIKLAGIQIFYPKDIDFPRNIDILLDNKLFKAKFDKRKSEPGAAWWTVNSTENLLEVAQLVVLPLVCCPPSCFRKLKYLFDTTGTQSRQTPLVLRTPILLAADSLKDNFSDFPLGDTHFTIQLHNVDGIIILLHAWYGNIQNILLTLDREKLVKK